MVSRGKVNILDKLVAYIAICCLVLSFSFRPVYAADAPTEGSSGGESSSALEAVLRQVQGRVVALVELVLAELALAQRQAGQRRQGE